LVILFFSWLLNYLQMDCGSTEASRRSVGATAGKSGGILFPPARIGLGTILREVLEDEPVHDGQIRDLRHVVRLSQIFSITFTFVLPDLTDG
jgi:hypothetical protein